MTPDEVRFTALVNRCGPRVLAFLRRRTNPQTEAADAFAEVLSIAWRRIDQLPDDETEATAWLLGVARRTLANQRRAQQRRQRLADRLRDHLATQRPSYDGPSPDALAVRRALGRLAPADREVLTLAAWEGLSSAEIAIVLGASADAVRQRLVRARGRLRERLASEGFEDQRGEPRTVVDAAT